MGKYDVFVAVQVAKCAYLSGGGENQASGNEAVRKITAHSAGAFTALPPRADKADRNDFSGYYGYAIKSENPKQIFIGHRGSENAANWIESNINIGLGKVPSAWLDALLYSQKIRLENPGYQIIETGHSLGGVHAILNTFYFKNISSQKGSYENSKSITFDNPGCSELIKDLLKGETIKTHLIAKESYLPKKSLEALSLEIEKMPKIFEEKELRKYINCYLSAPNIVNTCNTQTGNLWRLYFPHTAAQSVGNLVASASQLINLFNPTTNFIDWSVNVATWWIAGLSTEAGDYIRRLHDINRIADTFDPVVHMPRLLRNVEKWPSLTNLRASDYWNKVVWNAGKTRQVDTSNHSMTTDLECEYFIHRIENYRLGDFWFPGNDVPVEAKENYLKELTLQNKHHSNIFSSWIQLFCTVLEQQDAFNSNDIQDMYITHVDIKTSGIGAGIGAIAGGAAFISLTDNLPLHPFVKVAIIVLGLAIASAVANEVEKYARNINNENNANKEFAAKQNEMLNLIVEIAKLKGRTIVDFSSQNISDSLMQHNTHLLQSFIEVGKNQPQYAQTSAELNKKFIVAMGKIYDAQKELENKIYPKGMVPDVYLIAASSGERVTFNKPENIYFKEVLHQKGENTNNPTSVITRNAIVLNHNNSANMQDCIVKYYPKHKSSNNNNSFGATDTNVLDSPSHYANFSNKSDNLVRILGYVAVPAGLIMEYLPLSLDKIIFENNLSPLRKLQIAQGIAKGLKYLHDNRRAYKFLDPSHVLIGAQENGPVKLMYCKNATGSAFEYKAPEIFDVAAVADNNFPADIYSLAILLYVLKKGCAPFENKSEGQIRAHFKKNLLLHPLQNNDVRQEDTVTKLIVGGWKLAPDKRPLINVMVNDLTQASSQDFSLGRH